MNKVMKSGDPNPGSRGTGRHRRGNLGRKGMNKQMNSTRKNKGRRGNKVSKDGGKGGNRRIYGAGGSTKGITVTNKPQGPKK